MMRVLRFAPWLFGSAAAAIAVCIARPLPAQQGVITGRVTSADGGALGGVTVTVVNTNVSAVTAADGTYRLTIPGAVPGRLVTLTARYIGHRPGTQVVTPGAGPQEVNFQLAKDPFRLEEVVVTGTAEATAAKNLSFAVSKVSAEDLPVPGASALVGIQGKVAGARFIPSSAQPGGEVAIRLRGATSIGGRQDPLFIVDGVITRFGLADIAPEDIERVEVLKGAAASSLYGSDAANGVVQIFTKRGRSLAEGALRVTTRVEGGINQMPTRMKFNHSHYWCLPADTLVAATGCRGTVDPTFGYVLSAARGRITKKDQVADNAYKRYFDSWDAIVENGRFWTGYVSASQRRGNTNFSTSLENTRNEGVIYGLGGYTRQNFRINLDQQFRSNLNGSFSAFYANSTNGRAVETGGAFFSLMFLDPDVNISDTTNSEGWGFNCVLPYHEVANQANPLCELRNRKIEQNRNRFTGSGRLQWRLTNWLSADGNFAYDQEAQTYNDNIPFGYPTATGNPTKGWLQKQSNNNYQYNSSAFLTGDWTQGSIHNTTRVGALLENQKNSGFGSFSGTLLVADVPEFAGADPSAVRSYSSDQTIRNRQYLAVSTFTIKDRYILDGLVRRDGSSLFGPDSRWTDYYRASAAWRANEDFHLPSVDEWKLRASYGTAGLRPSFEAQYEILSVTPGGFTKEVLGNPDLKPARSGELEVGTDLAFGNGRFSLEYNYSVKTTKDQLLQVDLPAVAGFKAQWQNTGTLQAKTHEVSLGIQLVNSRSASVQLNITGDRARNVITKWTIPERIYGPTGSFFLGENSDLGVMYGLRWVRSIDELYDDPGKVNADGTPKAAWVRDSVMVNEDGYVVRTNAYGTLNERPIPYIDCVGTNPKGIPCNVHEIGNANPDFVMGFNLAANIKRLAVYGVVTWQKGGNTYNGTRQWAMQAVRDRVQDQSGKPANDAACATAVRNPVPSCPRKASPYYSVGFYNGLASNDFFVEPGGYAKLKELSVGYTFVRDQLRRIGLGGLQDLRLSVIGRNLFRITDYSGLDPEVSGLIGDPFQVRIDWFQYPQYRQFSTSVELTF